MAKEKKIKNADKPNCFVIMPFGGYFDSYYTEIYSIAIEEAGFNAKRGDDLFGAGGNIVSQIWNYTQNANVVLADLTTKNANVFYELGLAHAITKPVVLIAASMEDVPFDLRSLRIIIYDRFAANWGTKLSADIVKALKDVYNNPEDSIPPTFLEDSLNSDRKIDLNSVELDILKLKKEVTDLRRNLFSETILSHQTRSWGIENLDDLENVIRTQLNDGRSPSLILDGLVKLGINQELAADTLKEVQYNESLAPKLHQK